MKGPLKFLKFVLESPPQRQTAIIGKNKQIVKQICDILLNILLLNVKVKPIVIKKLKQHKTVIYQLVNKKISDKKRQELLLHNRAILKIIATVLPSIYKSIQNEPLYQNVSNQ